MTDFVILLPSLSLADVGVFHWFSGDTCLVGYFRVCSTNLDKKYILGISDDNTPSAIEQEYYVMSFMIRCIVYSVE